MAQKKVTIVGSGNWGSAIARFLFVRVIVLNLYFFRIIGNTVVQHNTTFQTRVPMWVFEEVCFLVLFKLSIQKIGGFHKNPGLNLLTR